LLHAYLFIFIGSDSVSKNHVHALFGVEKINMSQVVGILVISLLREKTNISVWLDHIVGCWRKQGICHVPGSGNPD
jgi:hypothetical protein